MHGMTRSKSGGSPPGSDLGEDSEPSSRLMVMGARLSLSAMPRSVLLYAAIGIQMLSLVDVVVVRIPTLLLHTPLCPGMMSACVRNRNTLFRLD